jgi:carbon monoxide dehydrogenase subunit G
MKLSSSARVPAAPDRVFAALVNPEVLRRSIPGCESLMPTGPDTYEARLQVGVAGLKGSYSGRAELRDQRPFESLTLAFSGKGVPGFVQGAAAVQLKADNGGTLVTLTSDVQVGGLIAAVGSRLIEAAARKLADDFFRRLSHEIVASHSPA